MSTHLNARIATLTDSQVEDAVRELYASPRKLDQHERLVAAKLADELTRRWGVEAELDRVFLDDEFTGTYYEALLIAREARHSSN